jgi:tetratricopeptide (TPR) repeat protein
MCILPASLCGEDWLRLYKTAYELQSHQRYGESAALYTSALKAAEGDGLEGLPVALCLSNLGYVRQQMGEVRVASRMYARALSIFERDLPAGDHRIFDTVLNLSNVHLASGETSRAEALIRRFLEQGKAQTPEERAALVEELGTIALERGDLADAEQMYRESLAAFLQNGSDKERIVVALGNLSVVCGRLGDIRRARDYIDRAQAVLASVSNPSPSVEVKTWATSAALLFREHRLYEADEQFQKVIARCERAFGSENYLLGYVLNSYARCLSEMNRKKEARQMERQAKTILDRFKVENRMGSTVDAKTVGKGWRP